jgi:hypothetical protein
MRLLLRATLYFSLIFGLFEYPLALTYRQAEGRLAEPTTIPKSLSFSRAGTQFDGYDKRMALKGESATGSEVSRDERNLVINLKPCAKKGDYMSFHKPYVEEDAGETVCDGRTVKLKAITQR